MLSLIFVNCFINADTSGVAAKSGSEANIPFRIYFVTLMRHVFNIVTSNEYECCGSLG